MSAANRTVRRSPHPPIGAIRLRLITPYARLRIMTLEHWHLSRDGDGIAWATLDRQGTSTNTLSAEVMAELAALLDDLERDPPRGLIFRSGKSAGFIAGADIEEFTRLDSAATARALVQRGWDLYNR